MNPLSAVGLLFHVVRVNQSERFGFLGTCFSFRQQTHFLTATHCIANLSANEVAIGYTNLNGLRQAKEIIRHPTADIALIRVSPVAQDPVEPFWNFVSNYSLGEDFMAYGFPENVFGADARRPVARLFRGYFQRFMDYESRFNYRYVAGELNIACPGGLSGGPLFRPGAPVMLTGLVTENLESSTFLHSVEEIQRDGTVVRERYQNVINYGICLMLDKVGDWLDSHVPKHEHAA